MLTCYTDNKWLAYQLATVSGGYTYWSICGLYCDGELYWPACGECMPLIDCCSLLEGKGDVMGLEICRCSGGRMLPPYWSVKLNLCWAALLPISIGLCGKFCWPWKRQKSLIHGFIWSVKYTERLLTWWRVVRSSPWANSTTKSLRFSFPDQSAQKRSWDKHFFLDIGILDFVQKNCDPQGTFFYIHVSHWLQQLCSTKRLSQYAEILGTECINMHRIGTLDYLCTTTTYP